MSPVLFNILIVDSNVEDAGAIESLLRHAFSTGVDVFTAANLESAKSHLAIRDVHLVIADMHVAPFAGPAVVEQLRRVSPTLPIICVTRAHDPGMSLGVLAAGAAMLVDKASLQKPDQSLATAVVNILAEARQRTQGNGLTRQINAMHNLLQQTHERMERVLAAVENHDKELAMHTQRIDGIDRTVREHERQRRGVLAFLWALATALIVSIAGRLF